MSTYEHSAQSPQYTIAVYGQDCRVLTQVNLAHVFGIRKQFGLA